MRIRQLQLVTLASSLAIGLTGWAAGTASGATLSTTFASTEQGASGWTNLFNLNVAAPGGITITSITVNTADNAPTGVSIYAHASTYVGNEGSSAGWTLVSTGTGPAPGFGGGASAIDVTDFTLPAGTTGIAITNNQRPLYTTGATDFSDANLTIDNGATLRGSFGAQLDANKTWNGSITYTVPEPTIAAAIAMSGASLLRRSRARR